MEKKSIESSDSPVSFRFKFGILILLCFQNAGHALLARFSQSIRGESYSSTEVVLVAELMKVLVSGYLAITEKQSNDALPIQENSNSSVNPLYRLFYLLISAEKIIILVILYSVANLLSYYALARVDAAVYTVLLQLKILTTAAFFVLLLGRSFSGAKWRALLLLVIGCILVASPAFDTNCGGQTKEGNGDEKVGMFEASLGVGAILVMVTISGYSAVYFESMLKKDKTTVWERNFQLATYSAILLATILFSERAYTASGYVFFQGWTVSAFLLAVIQAGGGILVAATLKYADAILKTLATSGSIVLSAVLGYVLLDGPLDIFVSLGCICTILAIFNYTLDSTPTT